MGCTIFLFFFFLALTFPMVTLGSIKTRTERKQGITLICKYVVHLSPKCYVLCHSRLKDTTGLKRVPVQEKLMTEGKWNN